MHFLGNYSKGSSPPSSYVDSQGCPVDPPLSKHNTKLWMLMASFFCALSLCWNEIAALTEEPLSLFPLNSSKPHDGPTVSAHHNELLLQISLFTFFLVRAIAPQHSKIEGFMLAACRSHSKYTMNCGPRWSYWFLKHLWGARHWTVTYKLWLPKSIK